MALAQPGAPDSLSANVLGDLLPCQADAPMLKQLFVNLLSNAVKFTRDRAVGHIEIGSVSAELSHGNARPRLFRLPADRAIVVNYGLPNDGAAASGVDRSDRSAAAF